MLNNGNKTNCGFADEIVSYIYDEIGTAERMKFETHLAGCHECTNEFADISHARFSVFEWQKEEFAHLSTPEIAIPYAPKRTIVEENTPAGFLSGLRGLLSFVNLPVAVAAGLILFLGIGFLAVNYLGRGEQHIASNNIVTPIEPKNKLVVSPPVDFKKSEITVNPELPTTVRLGNEFRPVKIVEHRPSPGKKQLNARNSVNRNAVQNNSDPPVLSENYEEADDKSLRLSDLFAEVDG